MGWRPRVRDAAACTLARLGVTRPERWARGQLTVVTFHRVLPERERRAYPFPGLAITPDDLSWHLHWLTSHFRCATLAEAHEAVRSGKRGERPWLAVTFDDGQLDNYVHAAPRLARAGVPATFFVPVAHVESGQLLWHDRLGFAVKAARGDRTREAELRAVLDEHGLASVAPTAEAVVAGAKHAPEPVRRELVTALDTAMAPGPAPGWAGMMGWSELGELGEAGHEVGSHTMTHPILPGCDERRLEAELADSRSRIEAELRRPAESFCYPNGDADTRVVSAVRAAGYRRAVTTRWGRNPPDRDPWTLLRCDIRAESSADASGALSSERLAWRLSGLHPGLG